MKAADAIIKCLQNEKVDTVFGYPGAAVVSIYEAIRRSKIKHVLVRQEQAAAHCANGYARISGKVGVCIATSGPGATNLITGIATAYMDSIPLVIITGQVKSAMIGRDVFQEADITGATESFTKYSYLVKDPKELPRIIKEAFYIASTGRPGPVLIDIPSDIQDMDIEYYYPEDVDIRGYKPVVNGHMGQIKRAVKALSESERPLIVAGGGIILSDAKAELLEFVEKTGIPVVYTLMGKGVIPTDNKHNYGMIGTHGCIQANRALTRADLLIFIGARIADRSWGGISDKTMETTKIIHIDVDPAEIGKNLGTHIPLVGDAKRILTEMLRKVEPSDLSGWVSGLEKVKKSNETPQREWVDPQYAIRLISDMMDDDAVLVADVGQNQIWAARNFEDKIDRSFITSGGLGTMGYALPAAEGVKFANPKRQVVAVVGDGGFQMSMFELGTIAANNLNLVILLINNSRLGLVREIQHRNFKNTSCVNLDKNPDFVKLCSAYGIEAVRVTVNSQLKPVYERALKSNGPFLVECVVDPNESTI